MGVTSGYGCKEVYRFPHITYPYSSCISSFLKQHLYFLFIFKMFFVLIPVLFVIKIYALNNFSRSINTHMDDYGRLTAVIRRVAHNVLYMKKHTQTNASYPAIDINCMPSRGGGVDLELEGRTLYKDASRARIRADPPPSRGGDLELEGGVNVSL